LSSYYHVYNRGVKKRKIFCDKNDFKRFIISIREFNDLEISGGIKNKLENSLKSSHGSTLGNPRVEPWEETENRKLVEILAYCLIPNHYHLLLK